MSKYSMMNRRSLLATGGAALALAGCSNGVGNNAAARLDARVDQTHQFLLQNYPNAAPLIQNAKGVL